MSSFFAIKLDILYFCVMEKTQNISAKIRSDLERLPQGYIFTYGDLLPESDKAEAVIKALNRMVKSGRIAKVSKGRFYRPVQSPFGSLKPDQTEIIKDLLEENGKVTGYLTGYSVFNALGLTPQVSNIIQIGKNQTRPAFTRGQFTIQIIRQKNRITKDTIPLLQILDAVKNIRKIPGASVESSCRRLLILIKNLSLIEVNNLVKLAMQYPPAARALTGALLEVLNLDFASARLRNSLNPLTAFKIPGAENVLSSVAKDWNIR